MAAGQPRQRRRAREGLNWYKWNRADSPKGLAALGRLINAAKADVALRKVGYGEVDKHNHVTHDELEPIDVEHARGFAGNGVHRVFSFSCIVAFYSIFIAFLAWFVQRKVFRMESKVENMSIICAHVY